MSAPIFERGMLTDYVLTKLGQELSFAKVPLLVGDGIAPQGGGWTGGQPGQGTFKPYIVVMSGAVVRNQRDSLGRNHTSWRAMYSVKGVGADRQQADWGLDRSRYALLAAQKAEVPLGTGTWQIASVQYDQLGPVIRNDSFTPALWETTDTVALWVEEKR